MWLLEMGEMGRWSIYPCLGMLEAVGGKTICQHQILAPEYGVVACCLMQCCVVDGHARLFALYDDQGLMVGAYANYIGTLSQTVYRHGVLLDNLLGEKSAMTPHVLHDVATYPLLGGEHKPATSGSVEYLGATIGRASCL